jgi:hypothetical protein
MEGDEQVSSSSSLVHISQEGSLKGAGERGGIKVDRVLEYEGLSWSCHFGRAFYQQDRTLAVLEFTQVGG